MEASRGLSVMLVGLLRRSSWYFRDGRDGTRSHQEAEPNATTVQAPYRQRERSFDLQVMGGASAASRLLVELRCPLLWQRFEGQAFGSGPDFMAVGPVERSGVFADCF